MDTTKVRLIAFYLPQFHPIPENDAWWGKGFTEWTNVAKATPLFPGHYQPNLPSALGFYDLRVPEVRQMQAELAQEHSIAGFCYWHYWFGNGRRLLERPFQEVLASGKPDFPFCLAWANHTWSGIWVGKPNQILLEQTYPGEEDDRAHFQAVVGAFKDSRYMTVDGKPIFVVFEPYSLPNAQGFTSCWQELSQQAGLPGIYFVGMSFSMGWNHYEAGFDAITSHPPKDIINRLSYSSRLNRWRHKLLARQPELVKELLLKPRRYSYEKLIPYMVPEVSPKLNYLPNIIPNWDNTPRSQKNGYVFLNSTPHLFGTVLKTAVERVIAKPASEQIVFIQAWNEWAEGNYLEPDRRWGKAYLETVRTIVQYRYRPIK